MLAEFTQPEQPRFNLLFIIGFCLVVMTVWTPVFAGVQTFMFGWKVELTASLMIAATSAYFLFSKSARQINWQFNNFDIYGIILPLTAFILWSAASSLWATSIQSTLMHTAIWAVYLIFYVVIKQVLGNSHNFKVSLASLTLLLMIMGIPVILEYCAYLYFRGDTTLGMRFSKYAEIINLVYPLLIASVVRLSGRKFLLGVCCLTVVWLFLVSTMSRTGMILFVGGALTIIGIILLFKRFKKYRLKTAFLVLALVITPIPIHLISLLSPTPDIPIVRRFVSEGDYKASNNSRKMIWSVALEGINHNFLFGVGAANFGINFNHYRMLYGERNPHDTNLVTSESEIPERAHNEYLQVFTELGLIGISIFSFFICSILYLTYRLYQNRKRASLFSFAALIGMYLFLASSLLSSYSFRLIQNGLIFFFVLAVASKLLVRQKRPDLKKVQPILANAYLWKVGFAAGIILMIFLGMNSVSRALSESYASEIRTTKDDEQALALYNKAIYFNRENPHAYFYYSIYLLNHGRYEEASSVLPQVIRFGDGSSSVYSLLATSHALNGNSARAAETFSEAVRMYPQSTFVRTRYADLLRRSGNEAEAQNQLEAAIRINRVTANTWWNLYQEGVAKTNLKTLTNPDLMIVFDLKPENSYMAYLNERWIYHPEEKPGMNKMNKSE